MAKPGDRWRSSMTALIGWLNEYAPSWIVEKGDPKRTAIRVMITIISAAPVVGLVAFLAAAY